MYINNFALRNFEWSEFKVSFKVSGGTKKKCNNFKTRSGSFEKKNVYSAIDIR